MQPRYFMLGIVVLLCQCAFSQTVINGLAMPESITSDGKRFFISNQGQDFMSKDGDGFISEISADGKILQRKYLPVEGVLHAPKGMAIMGDVLYVADLDRIVGFDIATRKTHFELTIPGARLLNDVCRLEEGFIAVTETLSGDIYKVDIQDKSFKTIGKLPTVNGISYNETTRQLAVCSNGAEYGEGSVYLLSDGGKLTVLPNMAHGFFDGIEWMDDSHLLVSDWVTFPVMGFGKLWVYDTEQRSSQFFFTDESPADIHYERSTSKVYLPQMLHNRALIMDRVDWEQKGQERNNRLYNYGILDAFIGGLYQGSLPVKALKLKGDFGLGAPDRLEGELIMVDGKAYQTKATGETIALSDEALSPFASVTFFKADTVIRYRQKIDKKTLMEQVRALLGSTNALYAIKVSGRFSHVKTRAFPAVEKEPFLPLAEMLDRQRFFEYSDLSGDLVGFLLPDYLNGINAAGFHFHFLSSDKKRGGHLLEFRGEGLNIEIAKLKSVELDIPDDAPFRDFVFRKKENEAIKQVEQGKR